MQPLREQLRLKIDDYGKRTGLKDAVWDYFWFLRDSMDRNGANSFVHTLTCF